jgi:hypothetical protein
LIEGLLTKSISTVTVLYILMAAIMTRTKSGIELKDGQNIARGYGTSMMMIGRPEEHEPGEVDDVIKPHSLDQPIRTLSKPRRYVEA